MPLVSVIMATYNRGMILPETVDSILIQSLSDFELIIVDDCSTDNTHAVIKDLCEKDKRIRSYKTSRNSDCSIARNLAMEKAKGKYIAIMDDDDIAQIDRLERQSEVLNNTPEVGLVGSAVRYFDENGLYSFSYPGKKILKKFPLCSEKLFEDIYLGKYVIPNPSIMVRRELTKTLKYPAMRGIEADMIWVLQLAALGVKAAMVPDVLILMRRGDFHSHMSRNFYDVNKGRINRLHFMQTWLRENQISKFDHLHQKALENNYSNFLLDFAAHEGLIQGLLVYLQALIKNPIFVGYRSKQLFFQYLLKRYRKIIYRSVLM